MMIFGYILGILLMAGSGGVTYVETQKPIYVETLKKAAETISANPDNVTAWQEAKKDTQEVFPPFYPFDRVPKIIQVGSDITVEVNELKALPLSLDPLIIDEETYQVLRPKMYRLNQLVEKFERLTKSVPAFTFSENEKWFYENTLHQVKNLKKGLAFLFHLEQITEDLKNKNGRVVVLFQNTNEPRSNGGFTGSFYNLDFSENGITGRFRDIYATDRNVKPQDQYPAPGFMQDITPVISLRDANLWPEFDRSATEIARFFESADETVPDIIVAVNLTLLNEIITITGPIIHPKWDVRLTPENADIALQFLVESKINGRFQTKSPVSDVLQEIMQSFSTLNINAGALAQLNIPELINTKEIQVWAYDKNIQKKFNDVGFPKPFNANILHDDAIYFDFISIGANKTEKFIWTNITRKTNIKPEGIAEHRLNIRRTHALKDNELEDLLGYGFWPPNVQTLFNEKLRWILGEGENRTYLRVWIPKNANIQQYLNPSGPYEYLGKRGDYQIIGFPMFVIPGESLNIEIEYETLLPRGSHNWRPYHFETFTTPGRKQTFFTQTFEPPTDVTEFHESENTGQKLRLSDQEFNALYRFK